MTHGSLFSGIGGFDLAAQWAGFENIFQVEIDSYCQKVLAKNFPKVKRYLDIKEFDGTKYKGTIDIISGGFPCQPFSVAGKQKGGDDDRNLWPEMFRIIQEIKPTWIVGENVAAIINFVEFDNLLADLEGEGFEIQTFIIPACGVDAKHRRNRLWIVGYSNKFNGNNSGFRASEISQFEKAGVLENMANPTSKGLEGKKSESKFSRRESGLFTKCSKWSVEPGVGRVANGIPNRVDRLKGLGNAVVPQIPFRIFECIKYLTT